jgi:hypothetical protein
MAINPGFLGHGIFLQLEPINGLLRYADYKTPRQNPTTAQLVDNFIQALNDMHISSVWFELFTRTGVLDADGKQGTKELVAGLKAANIKAVPWGYCWGANSQYADPSQNDLQRAIDLCNQYQLECFVADIEPGNQITLSDKTVLTDKWDAGALTNLVTGLSNHFGQDNIGISSFANLGANSQPYARGLLPSVTPLVSFCAPQIYWNSRDPITWAQQSLQSWRDAGVTTDFVATVQSYWSTGDNTPPQADMEAKVQDFVQQYTDWSQIIGLNWYHGGWDGNGADEGGMSDLMIQYISAGRLDQKPYKNTAGV